MPRKAKTKPRTKAVAKKKPSSKKAKRPARALPAQTDTITVTLQTESGQKILCQSGRNLQQAAMAWSYIVRNRKRWAGLETTKKDQAKRSRDKLEELGISEADLRALAESAVVEVRIPFESEEKGWEARIFPWEYMLSAATEQFRHGRPLMIVRHLDRKQQFPAPSETPPEKLKLLIVESAPAGLRNEYTFDNEISLVTSNLALDDDKIKICRDEPREKLRQQIESFSPDVIHLTGFDTHQATSLEALSLDEEYEDGYLLRDEQWRPDPVGAEDLAAIINAAAQKPLLVSCNIYNSAARICPLIVSQGADAALGFQDEFDDLMTERFFKEFYLAWKNFKWDTLSAFKLAFKMLQGQPGGLHGTGVVLWSARPVFEAPRVALEDVEKEMRQERMKSVTFQETGTGTGDGSLREWIEVDVKPYTHLNYSMLHNNRDLFKEFTLRTNKNRRFDRIHIKVALYVGSEGPSYLRTVDFTDSPMNLNDKIRVPLIHPVWATIANNTRTGLFVEVTWQDQVLHRDTYPVTLLPLDEWVDTDDERVWLPSFVQWRDPAVRRIIDNAQRYLITVQDDSSAGFDGYQSITGDDTDSIDRQVQAIWWAINYDSPLSYINPPPAYRHPSETGNDPSKVLAQPIRTPSDVMEGRRGTCIDLAMLMAACLEYVEIYPVIFLLEGHAFPGYWRSDVYHRELIEIADTMSKSAPSAGRHSGAPSQKWSWSLGKSFYSEVLRQVREQRLVPLETVWLTQRGGFWEAVEEGRKNLRSKSEFHSLLDITQARREEITPIPMRGENNGR